MGWRPLSEKWVRDVFAAVSLTRSLRDVSCVCVSFALSLSLSPTRTRFLMEAECELGRWQWTNDDDSGAAVKWRHWKRLQRLERLIKVSRSHSAGWGKRRRKGKWKTGLAKPAVRTNRERDERKTGTLDAEMVTKSQRQISRFQFFNLKRWIKKFNKTSLN